MKTVLGSSSRYYLTVFSIFFIMSAFLTEGLACDNTVQSYQLTISSTSGGTVTIPGEGIRTYNAGTVVQLVATPDEGYEFREWTSDTWYIADPNSASTTITMNGSYSVNASFRRERDGFEPVEP